MSGASLMLAHQVAAKATRDGLFLSRFSPEDLPKIVVASAILAMTLGIGFARLLARFSPAVIVPVSLAASAAGHLVEYLCLGVARDITVVILYFHIVGFGAILLSGFWSVVNESFDPREAKLRFGRIAGAGTAGGIAGGLLAERFAALVSTDSLVLLLATLHACASVVLYRIKHATPPSDVALADENTPLFQTARLAFRQTPFLWSLALTVLLGTISATLLDFLFKSGATAAYGKGPMLTRYFAIFYTGGQLLTFLVQTFLTPVALQTLGLGRSVMTLSAAVAAGSGAALYIPVFPMIAGVRILEQTLRGSLFRSGYELFFTPIPAQQKRSVKTILDVGCDRFGDALGALLLQVLILFGPQKASTQILLFAAAFGALTIWITSRMDRAYLNVLEQGLLSRAVELNEDNVEDATTRSAVLATVNLRAQQPPPSHPLPVEDTPRGFAPVLERNPAARNQDMSLTRLAELRSGMAERVRDVLRSTAPFDPILAAQVIRLLAWNDVTEDARAYLVNAGHRVLGQLTDTLIDPDQDAAVRRRIPRILARSETQRAVEGLLEALADPRFEIRFQVSRALDFMKQTQPDLHYSRSKILNTVERELSVSRPIWEGRKLLDTRDITDSQYAFLDELLQERADQSLEHVFSLLAVLYPRGPLQVAFRALHSEDRMLRGLGIEYLEGLLPTNIFDLLSGLLDVQAGPPNKRASDEVLEELMASQQSIILQLREAGQGIGQAPKENPV
jgi:ATP:ADP antiporter, AAA family